MSLELHVYCDAATLPTAGEWAKANNAAGLIRHAEEAEKRVLPFYLNRLAGAAPGLVDFFLFVQRTFKSVPASKAPARDKVIRAAGIDLKTANRHRQQCVNVEALDFADPNAFANVPHDVRHACLLANNLQDLWSVRDPSPAVISSLRSLTKS